MRILVERGLAGLLALGLSGCLVSCGCPGYEKDLVGLDSRARAWLPAAPGATGVFENSRGEQKTVALVRYAEATESYFQGDECPEGKREVLRARWAGPALPDTLELTLYAEGVRPGVAGSFSGVFDATKTKTSTVNATYAATRQLGRRTFSQVVSSSCISNCLSTRVTEVYVAKELGLVAFRLQDELWVRQ